MKERLQLWKCSVPDETNVPKLRNYHIALSPIAFMQELKYIAIANIIKCQYFYHKALRDNINADAEQG